LLLYVDADGAAVVNHLLLGEGGRIALREVYDPVADRWPRLPAGAVAQVLDGDYDIRPAGVQALHLGGAVLVPAN